MGAEAATKATLQGQALLRHCDLIKTSAVYVGYLDRRLAMGGREVIAIVPASKWSHPGAKTLIVGREPLH